MFSNGFYVSLRKTTKIDIDENAHELPPDEGPFEEFKVADYICPEGWSNDGIFIQVDEKQPMWFDFRGNIECACLPAVQRINPVTGDPANLEGGLAKDPLQNYLKLPDQLWMDGYSKDGKVYQFIVVTEGEGLAVNEVVLPKHMQDSNAMGFAFYLPKPREKRENPFRNAPQKWRTAKNRHTAHWSSPQNSCDSRDITGDVTGGAEGFVSNSLCGNAVYGSSDNASFDFDRAASVDVENSETKEAINAVYYAVDSINVENDLEHKLETLDKASMGAGGRIGQDIIVDNNTAEYYQEKPAAILTVYLALPEMFEAIIKKGRRQDASKKDKYKMSGEIGGVPVPLVC